MITGFKKYAGIVVIVIMAFVAGYIIKPNEVTPVMQNQIISTYVAWTTLVAPTPAPAAIATQLPSIATLKPDEAMNRLVSVFAAACKKALDNPNPSPEINKIGVGCILVASAAVTAKLTGYTVNVITEDPKQDYMGGTCLPLKNVMHLEFGSTYFYWDVNQGGLPNNACGPYHLNVINFGTQIAGYYYYYTTSVNGNVEIGITKAH